jgi:hypothetical protein
MDRRVMLSCMDPRVMAGLCMAGFAVGAAVDIAGARRHWKDLKTIPPATPEVSAELREHREGKLFFSVVRAIGGIAMTILLAYLLFFVEPGS